MNGAGGGDVFPFRFASEVFIFLVTRLEILIFLYDFAVTNDAATDASTKGEIEGFLRALAGFGESGEIGVVFDIDRLGIGLLEHGSKIEVVPRKVAKPGRLIILDNAWHGDRYNCNFANDEASIDLLRKIRVEGFLTSGGGEFDGVKNFAALIYERNDSLSAADINAEIHVDSISGKLRKVAASVVGLQKIKMRVIVCKSKECTGVKMSNDTKYKRWAWGALIGLAAVIIVAGLVMAMTLTSPKPNEQADSASTVAQVDKKASEGEKDEKTNEESEANNANSQSSSDASDEQKAAAGNQESTSSASANDSASVSSQKTDSVKTEPSNNATSSTATPQNNTTNSMPKTGPEELIIPIVALAICGYLFAYNVALFKKNA